MALVLQRQQSLDAVAAAQREGVIADLLDLPGLTEQDRLRIESLDEFESNALRKKRDQLSDDAEKSFGNALKDVKGAYTGTDSQGNLVPSPDGQQVVNIMMREFQDKLEEVRNMPDMENADEGRLYRKAAALTIQWAQKDQGVKLIRTYQVVFY